MRKLILALSICAVVPCVCIAVAHAEEDEEFVEETRSVGQRMSCNDIKQEIDALNAMEELEDEDVLQLEKLQSDYRAKCMKRATGRSTGRARVKVTEVKETVEEGASSDTATACDNPDKNGCCPGEKYTDLGDLGWNCCTANNEKCFPPMAVKKDFSLCDDGTTPNKDGCCAGETYTDLGDLGWNCCEADGVTCFPPIKK